MNDTNAMSEIGDIGRNSSMNVTSYTSEPSAFGQIKHSDEQGEWWDGRELMPLYGYGADWRNFLGCIDGARTAAVNNGLAVQDLFVEVNEKTGGRPRQNFKLRRHAAYLVAMEGDASKPEIASAKHYFATRTQEAERLDDMDRDLRLIVQGAVALQETRREVERVKIVQQRQGERQDQIEARVATLEGDHDWVSALGYARTHPPMCTEQHYLAKVGKIASRMAREQGVTVGKTKHPYFGQANTYPERILTAAFAEAGHK